MVGYDLDSRLSLTGLLRQEHSPMKSQVLVSIPANPRSDVTLSERTEPMLGDCMWQTKFNAFNGVYYV